MGPGTGVDRAPMSMARSMATCGRLGRKAMSPPAPGQLQRQSWSVTGPQLPQGQTRVGGTVAQREALALAPEACGPGCLGRRGLCRCD